MLYIQNHCLVATSLDASVKTLESLHKTKSLNPKIKCIRDCFFGYMCLLDTKHDEVCVICGLRPILIGDLCEKIAHNHRFENDDYDPNETHGNIVESWNGYEKRQICFLFYDEKSYRPPKYDLKPNNYMPWIPPRLQRTDGMGRNSEAMKIVTYEAMSTIIEKALKEKKKPSDSEIDELVGCLSGNASVDLLRSMTTWCGIPERQASGASRNDLRELLRKWMIENNIIEHEAYIKMFATACKSKSGGTLNMVCPHGAPYAYKAVMRGEGSRDYSSDIVYCMHKPPQLLIYDNAPNLGKHLKEEKKRYPSEFEHIELSNNDGGLYPDNTDTQKKFRRSQLGGVNLIHPK